MKYKDLERLMRWQANMITVAVQDEMHCPNWGNYRADCPRPDDEHVDHDICTECWIKAGKFELGIETKHDKKNRWAEIY